MATFHHKYLAKKSYHVLNAANRDAVAAAEAQQATLSRRVEERRKLLARERVVQTHQAMISSGSGQGLVGAATSVAFLYEPPPGFVPAHAPPRVTQEATPAASGVKAEGATEVHDLTDDGPVSSVSPPVPASGAALASLPMNAPGVAAGEVAETWEERRARHRTMSAQAVREELHPALRGAPVAAPYLRESGVAINAKPLGVLLRDTRCIRCGGIGHASVDRECPRFNDNPADVSRQVREDPVTKLRALGASVSSAPVGVAGSAAGRFKLVYNDEAYSVGGLAPDDPLQQVILDADDDEEHGGADDEKSRRRKRVKSESSASSSAGAAAAAADSSIAAAASSFAAASSLDPSEAAFLATLSEEDMRILLKQLKKGRRGDSTSVESESGHSAARRARKEEKRRKKEKKKKRKKSSSSSRRKRRRSSSSSSSSSSDSTSSSDEEQRASSHSRRARHRDNDDSAASSAPLTTSEPAAPHVQTTDGSFAPFFSDAPALPPSHTAPLPDEDEPPPLERPLFEQRSVCDKI